MAKGLTVTAIESTKPGASRREIADSGCPGLYLVVQTTGAKSWALRFRSPIERGSDGQRAAKKLTLGTVVTKPSTSTPSIGDPLTVGQARKLAADALDKVARKIDPTHEQRAEKAKAKATAGDDGTVDAAMVEFLKRYKGKKTQGLRESTRLLTAMYFGLKPDPDKPGEWKKTGNGVLKHWSGRPLTSITKRDAIVLLDGLVDAGHGVTANRTLTNLKTFFAWCAAERDLVDASPVAVLGPRAPETSRERKLTDAELAALWRAADSEGYPFGDLARLLILTGARRDEMREAPESEFELDGATVTLDDGSKWQGPLWTLPADRSKNGREHLMPLAPMAVDILRNMKRSKGSKLLFTTTGATSIGGLSKAKTRLDAAMLAELRKDDPKAVLKPWTWHDLRRTFYSGLQALGFSIEITEACVNHTSGTLRGVAKVYGRHKYLREKTAAFEAWARHVDGLVNGRKGAQLYDLAAARAV